MALRNPTQAALLKKPKRRKYGNKPFTTTHGERFDSRAEYRRWQMLVLLQDAGDILHLNRQVHFALYAHSYNGAAVDVSTYIADFSYVKNGKEVVEDCKGAPETAVFRLKKKMMLACHGINVKVWRERK